MRAVNEELSSYRRQYWSRMKDALFCFEKNIMPKQKQTAFHLEPVLPPGGEGFRFTTSHSHSMVSKRLPGFTFCVKLVSQNKNIARPKTKTFLENESVDGISS